jgi:hypothetical protein
MANQIILKIKILKFFHPHFLGEPGPPNSVFFLRSFENDPG